MDKFDSEVRDKYIAAVIIAGENCTSFILCRVNIHRKVHRKVE